jgi:PAS domain S-box-containing protein
VAADDGDLKEEQQLRAAALKAAEGILIVRQRAERELVAAKEALEKKSEELRQQHEWFEVTLASIGDAVITTDTEGKVTYLNPIAEAMTGRKTAEARGQPLEQVFQIVNEFTGKTAINPVQTVLSTGKIIGLANHTALIDGDGNLLPIEDSAAPIRDTQGNICGVVMVFHDVTQRRRDEAALREARARLEVTLNAAEIGTWIWDVRKDCVIADKNLADLFSVSPELAQGGPLQSYLEAVHSEDRERVREALLQTLNGEAETYEADFRLQRADGSVRWVVARGKREVDEHGAPIHLPGVIIDITDRKRAEEAVRREAERLQLALAAGELGDWIWNVETDHVSLSNRAAELFGVPANEPIEWARMGDRFIDNDGEVARLAVERALTERSDYNVEYRVVHPSGQTKRIAARGRGIYTESGVAIGMIGVVQDITAREQANEVHSRLAAVVESSDDAIISKTLDGMIVTWNSGAARMFGYTAEEMIGRPITVLIPPEHVNEEPSILARLARGERIEHYETVRRKKDGTLLHVSLTVSPIRNAHGVIVGASKIARDITERKRAEQELLEQTRILELLNTAGTSIAAQLDLQALVQTVTDAATQLSGARFGSFFYNTFDQHGEAFLLYSFSGAPREAFEKLEVPRSTTIPFTGADVVRSADITTDPRYRTMAPHRGIPLGHLPVRSYLAVPVISRSGEVLGGLFFGHPEIDVFTERAEHLVMGVAAQAAIAIDNARLYEAAQREIASRERAEAALRETDRRKDEFLATLAHELRNPLAPIRQAALIAKSPAASEKQKLWSYDVIGRQVQHMALLLDDLLDISRITRGTLELRTEMVQLAAIVEAAVETARPVIDAKRHRLSIELPREPVSFSADPLRLAQVLSNLLTNAAKYTDPEGQIRLRATCADGSLTLSVTDTGIGIPPDNIEDVFAMFSQVRSSQDRSEGGLGIGLAFAKGLVALHGGTLEAKSAGMGHGSEFIVRLPLRRQSAAEPRAVSSPSTATFVKRRVLIADDNRDAAESLAMLLQIEGHEVTVVHDGSAAISAFNTVRPEVVLLDIGMPELNGYEVARQVRQSSRGRQVMLIAVTGWGQASDKVRALAAGFNHHFTKPIDSNRLNELLRSPA